MKDKHLIDARNMFDALIKSQPNLIKDMLSTKENGEKLADFMDSFIRKYSAHLAAQDRDSSRQ